MVWVFPLALTSTEGIPYIVIIVVSRWWCNKKTSASPMPDNWSLIPVYLFTLVIKTDLWSPINWILIGHKGGNGFPQHAIFYFKLFVFSRRLDWRFRQTISFLNDFGLKGLDGGLRSSHPNDNQSSVRIGDVFDCFEAEQAKFFLFDYA